MKSNILKRTLSALLATVMAGSMLATGAFAADGDIAKSWDAAAIKTEGSNRGAAFKDYEVVDDAIVITGNEMGTKGQPIYGCEVVGLDISKSYTVSYLLKLNDDSAVDGAMTFMAADPKIRLKADGQTDIEPNDKRAWYTLNDLREAQAESDTDGFFSIDYVISPDNNGYSAYASDPDRKLAIENRLGGPSAYDANLDPASAAENRVTDEAQTISLAIKSISVVEGNVAHNYTGWKEDGHYYIKDVMQKDKLVPAVSGKGYCYVDDSGNPVKNVSKTVAGKTYYFDASGVSVGQKFVKLSDGKYYYFEANYTKATQAKTVTVTGVKYAIKSNGEMVVNSWYGDYYFGSNGRMYTNRIIGNNGVDAQGKKIKNKVSKVGSKYYAFDTKGNLIKTGKLASVAGKKTIANKSGIVSVNKKVGSYIVASNGYCLKNTTKKLGKKTYAVNSKYKVVTGTTIAKIGSKKYAVVKGAVKTGKKNQIVKVKGKKYATDKKGKVLINKKKIKIGKKVYKTNKKGIATLRK